MSATAMPASSASPTALVTGASSGTGRDIALALAEDGYDVALLGRRAEALAQVADRIQGLGRRARTLAVDLQDAQAVVTAMQAFLQWSQGRVDILVNAAGIPGPLGAPVGEIALPDFDAVMATNLRGPFLTMGHVLPIMCRQGFGRVVNIGGNHGLRGRAGRAAYATSKWALRGLTRSAALEVGRYDVTVNLVAPGAIAVDRMKQRWADQAVAQGVGEDVALAQYIDALGPVLKRPNDTGDIVASVRFLVGAGGRNITGQEIVVDGGVVV